jgi:hypothetical protein
MSEEGRVCLEYDEEEEDRRLEDEKKEQEHYEQEMTDMAQERYWEDLDQRRWKWIKVATVFNGPIKVNFT